MIIKVSKRNLEEWTLFYRFYRIEFRLDRRYRFRHIEFVLNKNSNYGWELQGRSIYLFVIPREVLLKIESIIRGLNSNG